MRDLPDVTPQIVALEKRGVKLRAFMMSIVAGETHEHFLLTAAQLSSAPARVAVVPAT